MSYSMIHNADTSRLYKVLLDGELIGREIPSHHVGSVIYELESEGVEVFDEFWDEENLTVSLSSTSLMEDEYALWDEENP